MIKGYITNLGKYNEGQLVGEWITFPIDEDELEEVFNRIEISNKPAANGIIYEEYFFTDWDCIFDCDLSEYSSIETINDLAYSLENWKNDQLILKNACEIWSFEEVVGNDPSDYIFIENISSDYDLGYYYVEESGIYDKRDLGIFADFINYEDFGRHIYLCSRGGYTSDGWIEQN